MKFKLTLFAMIQLNDLFFWAELLLVLNFYNICQENKLLHKPLLENGFTLACFLS